jgi:hypothetical protein
METELRNYARDHWRTSSVPNESNLRRATENSHRQGPEVCPSWQACDFEAGDRPNDVTM